MQESKIDVSVIIVNFNTRELLKNCIASIYEHTKNVSIEIIVSDNASSDGSIEMLSKDFPDVICIGNEKNLGFGTANNRATRIARGKYNFYLNSDTILLNNAIQLFYDYFESHHSDNIGALGCNLLKADLSPCPSWGNFEDLGKINHVINYFSHCVYGYAKLWILNKLFKKEIPSSEHKGNAVHYVGKVDYVAGADIFCRNDENALFDENFFLFYEEPDLQLEMTKKGLSQFIIDEPKIIHFVGGSSEKSKNIFENEISFTRVQYLLSKVYYYKKHGVPKIKVIILKALICLLWCNPALFSHNKKYIKEMLFK